MAINNQVIAELAAQRAWIGEIVDARTAALAARWLQAWDQISIALEASLTRLLDDPDGITTHGVVHVEALIEENDG